VEGTHNGNEIADVLSEIGIAGCRLLDDIGPVGDCGSGHGHLCLRVWLASVEVAGIGYLASTCRRVVEWAA